MGTKASLFEALALLFGPDEGNHCFDLFAVEPSYRWHVAEGPVVLWGAVGDGRPVGVVGVMVGFVDDRQLRRSLVGAPEIGAVA